VSAWFRELSLPSLAAAVVVLGHMLQLRNGFYTEAAVGWLTAAMLLAITGVAGFRRQPASATALRILHGVVLVGLVWQLYDLARSWPGLYIPRTTSRVLFRGGMVLEACWLAAGVLKVRKLARVWFPGLVATHIVLGVWTLHVSPALLSDMVLGHDAAIDALRHGRTPFETEFSNLYGEGTRFYPPERVVDGRVRLGYAYPPLSLAILAPFEIVLGDYRLGLLTAFALSVLLIGYAGGGTISKLVAALLLTQPRGLFVLEQGWTEPLVVAFLSAAVALAHRPIASAWMAGWFLVAKQSMVLAVPFVARQLWARGPRLLAVAAAAGAVVTVPFFLWDPRGFLDLVVFLQFHESFRPDSTSYLSWAARRGWGEGSMLWALGAGAAAAIGCWRFVPNTPAGMALAAGAVTLAAFAFGSKAFANYYYFVVGAFCCAISAAVAAATTAK
jgi:hypothetical protein